MRYTILTIKEQVLELLEENRNNFISGEYIAKKLYCTRGAVWKSIKSLRIDGFEINAVTNRGYQLDDSGDVLSKSGVCRYLKNNSNIILLKTVGSTNAYLNELAIKGEKEGTMMIASEQTNGYGRRGRSFFSPADTGLYLSILLRPKFSAKESVKITAAAAVAACASIENVTGIKTDIKWVNDIFCGGKKVAGISTVAAVNIENGMFDHVIIGIGINVYYPKDGFPTEISDTAGALLKESIPNIRNKLAAEFYDRFTELYEQLPECGGLSEYKKRLMWQGEKINIYSGADNETVTPAVLLGIDDNFALKVRYENGNEDVIYSGEISIRRKNDKSKK